MNSFSVQLFTGSVTGTEVPEVVVEIVGKFPLKKTNQQIMSNGTEAFQFCNDFSPCHSHPLTGL